MKRLLLFSILFVNVSFAQTTEWIHSMGYSSFSSNTSCVMVENNDVYSCGNFAIPYDNGFSTAYEFGFFLEKRSESNNLIWSDTITCSGGISTIGASINSGHIYLVAAASKQVDFKGVILNYNYHRGLMAKYDLSGNLIWAYQDTSLRYEASCIKSNFLYAAGFSSTHNSYFVAKYDLNGFQTFIKYTDQVLSLSVLNDGSYLLETGGLSGMDTVKKLDVSGNLIWQYPVSGYGYKNGLTVDQSDNCYISGEHPGAGNFITKLDSNGSWQWTQSSLPHSVAYLFPHKTMSSFYSAGRDAAGAAFLDFYDSLGNCISSMSVYDNVITCMDYNDNSYYVGGHDSQVTPQLGFIAKINSFLTSVDQTENGNSMTVYPNPSNGLLSVHYVLNENKPFQLRIFSPAGKLVYEEKQVMFQGEFKRTIDLSGFAKGIYSVEILVWENKESRKVVLQ